METVHIYTDGASRGNPGMAAWAYVLLKEGESIPFIKESGFIGTATNNYAEYTAAIKALEKAVKMGYKNIVLHSDSQLLVNQLSGKYKVKSENIKPLYGKIISLLNKINHFKVVHERRSNSFIKIADKMCNKALDSIRSES